MLFSYIILFDSGLRDTGLSLSSLRVIARRHDEAIQTHSIFSGLLRFARNDAKRQSGAKRQIMSRIV